jgi:hypothetical protein
MESVRDVRKISETCETFRKSRAVKDSCSGNTNTYSWSQVLCYNMITHSLADGLSSFFLYASHDYL